MNTTISIFGCGWLGKPLAINLVNKGFLVKGSTTSKEKLKELQSNKIQPFLCTLKELPTNILEFLNAEILIVNIPSKNVAGFKNLISFIEKSNIQKVLFISSTSVFASAKEIITETTTLKNCPLKEIEELFQNNTHFKTTILRFAGLLGYQRKPGNWFKNGKIIPNPEGVVNMIHQDDCIEIIKQVIVQNCWNNTFNACADTHPKRRDFYTKSFLEVGREKPIFNENDEKSMKIIGNEKIKTTLKFKFKYPNLMQLPNQ
ncbi:NAD(P)-binding domain-containing protein [Lutibacter holmesii]|uniref:NAD(P)-binding domain-containing protein n=1 Tax=Lutibacter holmesii TaxID=1137985 RepID=A0ABW3WKI1_9FLAO